MTEQITLIIPHRHINWVCRFDATDRSIELVEHRRTISNRDPKEYEMLDRARKSTGNRHGKKRRCGCGATPVWKWPRITVWRWTLSPRWHGLPWPLRTAIARKLGIVPEHAEADMRGCGCMVKIKAITDGLRLGWTHWRNA